MVVVVVDVTAGAGTVIGSHQLVVPLSFESAP